MADRTVRSLADLKITASTARTLNLHAVERRHGRSAEYLAKPLFRSPVLNRSIILKHRLRRNEQELCPGVRRIATKVILPLDQGDLNLGGRFFFIGQLGYEEVLREVASFRGEIIERDAQLLAIMDTLPSLDPFLMRERLKQDGYVPARCYLDLSEADAERMYNFLRAEVEPLIGASFGDLDVAINHKSAKFADKILNNANDSDMEPLRMTLNMSRPQFEEGVFCWKGFIYYKWALKSLLPEVGPVADQIASVKTADTMDRESRTYVTSARMGLQAAIGEACRTANGALDVYDRAFRDLTLNGQPRAFREFLLKAPGMFYTLGERLGAVQHIVSFWRYRFPDGQKPQVNTDELIDILMDFEASLGIAGGQEGLLPLEAA